ncbi:Transcription initiation factor IID, 18kDa subunit [Phytophthora cinnamomi]|uniref:Transcription initiation factor IID, 18kDa subunit n=1 Tax=Phytophthora cinnamomi TaxID=4785 RepID=UPI00355A3B8A|nr:Transcription initiation factor IID, 18kDa subunit [Phytophthora cinnamomi]
MADAERSPRAAAADDDAPGAENEFGLQDLARLPLLEQVHRLFHAIQHQYPYKETNAWKTLPLDQKKKMLTYIREKRQRKAQRDAEPKGAEDETQREEEKQPPPPLDQAAAVRSDPYLKMLQQRSLRSAGPVADAAALPKHPNSAYVAPAEVPHYTQAKPKYKPRWQVAEGEFFEEKCACGVKHETDKKGKKASLLLHTISSMMSTFGDSTQSCLTTVEEVQTLVGDHMCKVLGSVNPEVLTASSCLRTLVEIFEEEAIYYGRWREFRGETKHEENELEDVEEEELAEELDLFAVSETEDVFNEAFLERIRFADERTKTMDWSIYDVFARGRKLNFMNNKAQQFRQWLGLGKISRASLEFLNFVAYHNIGRLVELAIKNRTGGELKQLETPLLKDDIEYVFFWPSDSP